MVGNIYIRGAGGQNTNVGITTFSGMAFFRDDLTVSSSGLAVNIFESTDNHSRFRIKSGSSSLAQLEFADQDDADAGEIRYDHGNDIMTFHVGNNTEKLRIDSSGRLIVGGGTDPAESTIVAKGNSTSATSYSVLDMRRGQAATSSGDVLGYIRFSDTNIPSSNNNYGLIFGACDGASSGAGDNPGRLVFSTTADGASGPTERLRIDSVGRVFFTNNTGSGTSRIGGRIELSQNNPETWITINESSDSGTGPALYINRTRGTNVSSPGPIQNGNYIGSIHFGSYDTNSYEKGASIQVFADGQTWANGDCPARMTFHTTPDNSTTPVERLRITRDGKIGVNATTTSLIAPTYTLDLGGNDGSLDTSEQNTLRIRCNNGGTAIRVGPGGGGSRVTMMRADGESSGNKCFGETDKSAYGVSLVYHGDRSGNENSFAVYMDQSTNANQIEAFNIRQNGDYMHGGSSYSDRDHKENITSIPGTALDKITQLTPRTWNWKREYHDIPTDKIFGGFIAQEVLPHIPSIVTGTDGQGDMALDYQGLLAWTIKALTELKSENDNLKARVNTLESS